MLITSNKKKESFVNISKIYEELCKENRSVIIAEILDEIFMFRPLSRIEYKEIVSNDDLTLVDKEDVICKLCVLYPENYDFSNCSIAGIPTKLANSIIKESYVNDVESYNAVINAYREEISSSLDSQIACIISEAFPKYDIEEIESWDIEKTAKYLTRAEFILMNLRGLNKDLPEYINMNQQVNKDQEEVKEESKEEVNLKGGKKQKIDIDKLREAQKNIPEIDWLGDSVLNEGIDALNVSTDTTPYALRVPEEY